MVLLTTVSSHRINVVGENHVLFLFRSGSDDGNRFKGRPFVDRLVRESESWPCCFL